MTEETKRKNRERALLRYRRIRAEIEADPEKKAEYLAKQREVERKYRKKNYLKVTEKNRKNYLEHREERLAYAREYYKKHREYYIAKAMEQYKWRKGLTNE